MSAAAGLGRQPRILLSIIVVLVAAVIGLGAALAMGLNGKTTTRVVATNASCDPADPACTLRQPIHVHADFALFLDGEQFDFNQPQFVSDGSVEQHPNVHIHPRRYTVVHVHLSGTTWGEFFRGYGFELRDPSTLIGLPEEQVCLTTPGGERYCNGGGKTWKFFLNGVHVDGIEAEEIGNIDRVLFSYGSESLEEVIAQQLPQVTDQACIPSETCVERIPPDEPEEFCAGRGACSK